LKKEEGKIMIPFKEGSYPPGAGEEADSYYNENLTFEPSVHQPKLLEAWENFIKTGIINKNVVPQPIADSWMRSRKHGVDPFAFSSELYLDQEKYSEYLEEGRPLLRLAMPIMENIYGSLEKTRYLVVLYNANGYHLVRLGQRVDLERSSKFSIREGLCFEENYVGTCGFSLVKYHLRPIYISGCEHYSKLLHYVTGAYAPILHPQSRNLIGVIGVTGARTMPNPHTPSIVVAAATAIENLMSLHEAQKDLAVYTKSLQLSMNSVDDGYIIMGKDGAIFDLNRAARKMFAFHQDVRQQHISTLPQMEPIRDEIYNCLENKHEIRFDSQIQEKPHLVHIKPLHHQGIIEGLLIDIKNIMDITKTYHQFTGYSAIYTLDSIKGVSPEIQEIKHKINLAVKSDSCIIIEGESGTGKEVIAQASHNASARRSGPFVVVNCAAIPQELLESTLFGHEKGAFTGAVTSHIGKFELADSGTLFLDEIGEMSPAMQAKLLRAIEERRIERVGGKTPIPVNLRILAATNRDIEAMCAKKLFREDLYYRLKVFRILVPPLRRRKQDIPVIAKHFISELSQLVGGVPPRPSDAFLDLLMHYDWPGNVRELKNAVQYALTMIDEEELLLPRHLNGFFQVNAIQDNSSTMLYDQNNRGTTIRKHEKQLIVDALAVCRGNKSNAARMLGISRATLYRKLND
jgi:sigma-54 dependent transcriptional regulator, acetoin dehydrogenase operon transcriptional activator AcoR